MNGYVTDNDFLWMIYLTEKSFNDLRIKYQKRHKMYIELYIETGLIISLKPNPLLFGTASLYFINTYLSQITNFYIQLVINSSLYA